LSDTPPRCPPASGSPHRANGTTTARMASSSRRDSRAPRRPPRSRASRNTSPPGMIRGVRPVYVGEMVHRFGERVFDVIEHEPGCARSVHRACSLEAHHRPDHRAISPEQPRCLPRPHSLPYCRSKSASVSPFNKARIACLDRQRKHALNQGVVQDRVEWLISRKGRFGHATHGRPRPKAAPRLATQATPQ
jgi:hypothetical protein